MEKIFYKILMKRKGTKEKTREEKENRERERIDAA